MPEYQLEIVLVGKDQASQVFSRISRSLEKIGNVTAGILLSRVILGISSQLTNLAASAVNAAAEFQMMQSGLEGLVARELSSITGYAKTIAEVFPQARIEAAKLMDELSRIAILSPYTVEATQQVFKMQMAFGFTAKQAVKMTSGLLNMAAGIGATQEMLQRMAYNLAQINLQGQVTKLDIRQLALAGLDLVSVLKFVGKEMGVVIEDHLDFNAAIASGAITWEDFATKFEEYANINFGGAAERLSRTLLGLKSTWHDVWILTMPKMLMKSVVAISGSIGKLLDIFILLREKGRLDVIGDKWGESVSKALVPINSLLDAIVKWIKLSSSLQQAYQTINEEGERVIRSIRRRRDDIGSSLDSALAPIKGIQTAFKIASAVMGTFARMAGQVWSSISRIGDGISTFGKSITSLWEGYAGSIGSTLNILQELLLSITSLFIDVPSVNIANGFYYLSDWVNNNQPKIAEFIELFGSWVDDVIIASVNDMSDALDSLTDNIVNSEILKDVIGVVGKAFASTWNVVKTVYEGLKYVGKSIATVWSQYGASIWDSIMRIVNAFGSLREESSKSVSLTVLDALTNLGDWIVENGPNIEAFFSRLADFVEDKLVPAFMSARDTFREFSAIMSVFDDNKEAASGFISILGGLVAGIAGFVGAFAGVGAVVATGLKIASSLASLAIGAAQAFTAIQSFMKILPILKTIGTSLFTTLSPIAIVVAAVAAAVALGVLMFTTNFGGFRDFIIDLWTKLQPVLMAFWELLQTAFGVVVTAVAVIWNAVLKPVLTVVANILRSLVFPAFLIIAGIIADQVIPIFNTLTSFINNNVVPVLQFLGTVLTPIITFIGNLVTIVVELVRILAESLVYIIQEYVIPALVDTYETVSESLKPILEDVGEFLETVFGPALQWLSDEILTPLSEAFSAVAGWVITIYDNVKKFAESLKNIHIPDWLERNSPSEIEQSLMGTSALADRLARVDLPRLERSLISLDSVEPKMTTSSGNISRGRQVARDSKPISISINTGPVSSDVDMYRLAYTVASVVRSAT